MVMNMIDYIVDQTTKYIEQMPKSQRKKYGQFFTSKETAIFMASLFSFPMPDHMIHLNGDKVIGPRN